MGLIFGLIVGVSSGLLIFRLMRELNSVLIFVRLGGLIGGLIGGLGRGLLNGGASCIKHFNLRRILYCKGLIPWNYARFLDYATQFKLMKRVGGGYVFYHRMLMEHFANMGLEQ